LTGATHMKKLMILAAALGTLTALPAAAQF
jgi:hypothetical protein